MTYYLGIDGGGTYTRCAIYNDIGELVRKDTLQSIHILKVGEEGIFQILNDYKNTLISNNIDVNDLKVAMGLAGYGNDPIIRKNIENSVHKVFKKAYITNDANFARIASLNNHDGVFVISGTGSIAFNLEDGISSRRGGFGYLLGDEGSAFWIGKNVLETFTKQADGRVEKNELFDCIMKTLNLEDPYQIIGIAASMGSEYRNWVANFSKTVSNLNDCEEVNQIFREAGKHLANLANAFSVKKGTKLSFGGSVLLNNQLVRQTFLNSLSDSFEVVEPKNDVEFASFLIYNNS